MSAADPTPTHSQPQVDPAPAPAQPAPQPAASPATEPGEVDKAKKEKKEKKKDKKEKKGGKGKKEKKKDKKKDKKKKKRKAADSADKYVLYQKSVQAPDADIEFFDQVFKEFHGRAATTLREDFCGAAAMACEWVKSRPENKAWGVDLDPEPLAWGKEHNLSKLNEEQLSRLTMIQGDVRDPREPKVEIIAAQNFSFCCFQERSELLAYFKVVHQALVDGGVFVMDIFGGPESQSPAEDETEHDDFSYIWDQKSYDAITNRIRCAIHFKFPDGSKLKNAFQYDWRLWTIRELKEILADAGFKEAHAYWEGVDEDDPDEGNGEFTRQESADNEDAWIAYVVGLK